MSTVIDGLLYAESHEWVRVLDGGDVEMGITEHAQDQLGDIVFLEMPEVGSVVARGDALGVVESVKTVSDVYAPVSGEVVAVNEALADTPETVNEDPFAAGWIVRIKPSDLAADQGALLDAAGYRAAIGE